MLWDYLKNTLKTVGADAVFCHETPCYRIDAGLIKCDYSENLTDMLRELESDIITFRKTLKENEWGLTNVIDDMLEACGKYQYRATQK